MTTWRDVGFLLAWLWLTVLIVVPDECECACASHPAGTYLQTDRED